MQLMPLHKLGPREKADHTVAFGVYLPWVSEEHGHRLYVKIIHEKDQFIQTIPPLLFALQHSIDPEYGDYWSCELRIDPAERPHAHSAWGEPGRYVYRFFLRNPHTGLEIDWIIDPFAREFGTGKLSAFTLGYDAYAWSHQESLWRTPLLQDLVIYELMLAEFGNDLPGARAKLDYLQDLGVNCLEIMPVSNVSNTIDWGFLPVGYFGVDERFGKRRDLQQFIDAAHQRGIAVILDVVYGHTSSQFPYAYLYRALRYDQNPFMGTFAKDLFGESTDFNRDFTRDYFYTVNYHWLDTYHCDGFRYDCVPNYWDGPMGKGYADLTYQTYQTVKAKIPQGYHWLRFQNGPEMTLIQCAEQLEGPVEIVQKTYSNCTWQNGTLGAATAVAHGQWNAVGDLGLHLGLNGYPAVAIHNTDIVPKSALQYIENHDHSRFICNFGLWEKDNILLQEGNRERWYKLQPYLIALMTAKGIPLIWQGQELGENYFIPHNGWGRVMLLRPVRWDYFYDPIGRAMIALFRKLLSLRNTESEFRHGEHYFYNHHDHYQSRGVLIFHRQDAEHISLVALNFSDETQFVPFTFTQGGDYKEMLHGDEDANLNIDQVQAGQTRHIEIPSNYGRIWRL
ncbi:MAG: alpha-amlyase [Desulfatitalea sp. BRH_c12]|nr:MAG: alpha-amlyase [Desulfatitalea sp. BRH_c12]